MIQPETLTVLGADTTPASREERAYYRLSDSERTRGLAMLHLAALILFTFPARPLSTTAMKPGWRALKVLQPGDLSLGPGGPPAAGLLCPPGGLRRRYTALQRGNISISTRPAAYPFLPESIRTSGWSLPSMLAVAPKSSPSPGTAAPSRLLSGQRFSVADGQLRLTLPPQSGYLLSDSQWPGRDVSRETPCPGLLVFHGMFHVKHPMEAANF